MTKKKSIFLLILVSVLLVVLTVATFARFPVGVYDYNSILGAISLDYDMEGGTAYTLTLAKNNTEDLEDINEVTDVLNARMKALGYRTYKITTLKDMTPTSGTPVYDIRITAKASDNLDSDIDAVYAYGEVTFYGGTQEDSMTVIMDEEPAIADAIASTQDDGSGNDVHSVQIKLTDYGYSALTSAISGDNYILKVTLGDSELINGSITTDAIQNKTITVSNISSAEDAARMALQLKTGGLKYKFKILDSVTISPILGENTPLYSIIAVSVLLVSAIVFFSIKYRGYGLIAGLSLYTFILVLVSMLIAVPGITVSFGGIMGIILASVLAIDGLIITIKRITEENELGKTVKAAVKTGYKRSFFPILNTNVLALVIGLALFALTTGTLYNFAVIFSIGVAVSFASTVLVSRMFTALILPLLKKPNKFLKLKRVVD